MFCFASYFFKDRKCISFVCGVNHGIFIVIHMVHSVAWAWVCFTGRRVCDSGFWGNKGQFINHQLFVWPCLIMFTVCIAVCFWMSVSYTCNTTSMCVHHCMCQCVHVCVCVCVCVCACVWVCVCCWFVMIVDCDSFDDRLSPLTSQSPPAVCPSLSLWLSLSLNYSNIIDKSKI